MNRVKMILVAMIATLSIGAVGANSASAANEGNVTFAMPFAPNPPGYLACDVTFDRTAWDAILPPTVPFSWFSELDSFAANPSGLCDLGELTSQGRLTKNAAGDASYNGAFEFEWIPGFGLTCGYEGSLSGTWGWWDSPTVKVFELAGVLTKASGNFLCPATVSSSMEITIDA